MREHTVNYHHGGILVRGGEVKYMDGSVAEFAIDPDKLCYWDLLGDLQELGYDIKKFLNLSFTDDGGSLKIIKHDKGILDIVDQLIRYLMVDIYVECLDVKHGEKSPDTLLPYSVHDQTCQAEELPSSLFPCPDKLIDTSMPCPDGDMELEVNKGAGSEHDSGSGEDDEEILVDVPSVGSDAYDERDQARVKVTKYVQLKRAMQEDVGENDNDIKDRGKDGDTVDGEAENTRPNVAQDGKVVGFESDYIESSDPGSYEETNEESDGDDVRRHRSTRKYYNPDNPLSDFFLDLGLQT